MRAYFETSIGALKMSERPVFTAYASGKELDRAIEEDTVATTLLYDVESVTELPQFAAAFSIISRYDRRSTVASLALEELTNRRVDLQDLRRSPAIGV